MKSLLRRKHAATNFTALLTPCSDTDSGGHNLSLTIWALDSYLVVKNHRQVPAIKHFVLLREVTSNRRSILSYGRVWCDEKTFVFEIS